MSCTFLEPVETKTDLIMGNMCHVTDGFLKKKKVQKKKHNQQ